MTRVIGKGRYATETYPVAPRSVSGGIGAFSFLQNDDSWQADAGGLTQLLGEATITIGEGSRILIEAQTSGVGSGGAGFAFIHPDTGVFPELSAFIGQEAYTAAAGTNRRTLHLFCATDAKAAGEYTVQIFGDAQTAGQFNGVGFTLALTELLP